MTAPSIIRQQDAERLFKAARNAGYEQVRLRFALDGTIDFVAGPATEAESPAENPLDRKLFHDTQAPPAR
jgi:hypothetical protein